MMTSFEIRERVVASHLVPERFAREIERRDREIALAWARVFQARALRLARLYRMSRNN